MKPLVLGKTGTRPGSLDVAGYLLGGDVPDISRAARKPYVLGQDRGTSIRFSVKERRCSGFGMRAARPE